MEVGVVMLAAKSAIVMRALMIAIVTVQLAMAQVDAIVAATVTGAVGMFSTSALAAVQDAVMRTTKIVPAIVTAIADGFIIPTIHARVASKRVQQIVTAHAARIASLEIVGLVNSTVTQIMFGAPVILLAK